MTQKEKDKIKETITWDTYPKKPYGGQSVSIICKGVTLKCEDLGFEVSMSYYRSQLENKQFCMTLFELFLDELK